MINYSEEQLSVIESTQDVVVNAVAGAGKTSTLIGYAEKNQDKRILYLVFNRSARMEAQEKFAARGLRHVRVETAHSLAFPRGRNVNLTNREYKAYDLREMLNVRKKDLIEEVRFCNHVMDMTTCFCNSAESRVMNIDYLASLDNPAERSFASANYEKLIEKTRIYLAKMQRGEIGMIHDFYLKMYQLNNPVLHYDIICFDEAQDASGVMLDVFTKQKARKVMVGDEHQQIYGWRFAVNALKNVDFDRLNLTRSYRFDPSVARLAREVLHTKNHLHEENLPHVKIYGEGKKSKIETRAVLGRTNSGVLVQAIEKVAENKIDSLYFEGNFHTYTYADEGGSVYDVLSLYNGNKRKIRDPLIKSFSDFSQLEEYVEQTSDAPLLGIINLVTEYRNELPSLISKIKDKHVENAEKAEAEIIFSTVHKAKGMEYDEVTLCNDFLSEKKIKSITENEGWQSDVARIEEDINIFYVGLTRTKNKLIIPKSILPDSLKDWKTPNIKILDDEKKQSYESTTVKDLGYSKSKSTNRSGQAYAKWMPADDQRLRAMYGRGVPVKEIATHFERTNSAVWSRIKKLGLNE